MKTTAKILMTSLAVLAAACSDSTGTTSATVARVQVSAPATQLEVGATLQLTATPVTSRGKPVNGLPVTWGSSDDAVATVSQTGLVTARGAGTVVVTAVSDYRSGTTTLTVRAPENAGPVASVEITGAASPVTVAKGAGVQLAAVTRAANGAVLGGRVVEWASSNPAVATVSSTGQVTAVAAGTAM
ncbi:MAG TPA: Ig-like domain-containing protein, partial [Longimicrobium sp.]|nr:Ig-like domain-containing protein [Longimicrobium sp.]